MKRFLFLFYFIFLAKLKLQALSVLMAAEPNPILPLAPEKRCAHEGCPVALERKHSGFVCVLIIKKRNDDETTTQLIRVAEYLVSLCSDNQVFVEPSVYERDQLLLPGQVRSWSHPFDHMKPEVHTPPTSSKENPNSEFLTADGLTLSQVASPLVREIGDLVSTSSVALQLGAFLSSRVDFIICLGGDGTLLHVNSLFSNNPVPPCLSFNFGSLGFLTPFTWDPIGYQSVVSKVIDGPSFQVKRARLQCFITNNNTDTTDPSSSESFRFLGVALNEVTIDRGISSFLTNLEICCDNLPITAIQADGLIVCTSTGSTAYSLSAGGTMMHPSVPAIQLTPICPHSLTSRPICLPDSVSIQIRLHPDARSSAWVHLDGRHRFELGVQDRLLLQSSRYPLPCITPTDHISDWFRSLALCLHWNTRIPQQPFASAL